MNKKNIVVVLVFSLVVYFVWTSLSARGEEKKVGGSATKNVRMIDAVVSDFRSTEVFSGFVTGVKQTDVSPKVGGYVTKMLKEEGEAVQSGEILAVLDGSELMAMEKSAMLSVNAINKTLEETSNFYDQKVDEAKTMLKKTKESYSDGDATKKDVKIGEEAVSSAKKMRDLQNAGAKANVAAAQGGELVAHMAAKNSTIVAPFSGVITKKYASVGSFAAPGTPLYAISSPADLEISLSVPGAISEKLSKGDAVIVNAEGQTGLTIPGYVFSASHGTGSATQKSNLKIRFADSKESELLSLGQYVSVVVSSGNMRKAMLIPEKSILFEYDDTFLYVAKNDGVVAKKKITLGESSGEQREVLSGISEGERVVIEGQYQLREGDAIEEKEL
ncbi:MAG: efflux RND transporter periplasmic adaptor subunit [Candidatus Moraniibacteriota bacterium]